MLVSSFVFLPIAVLAPSIINIWLGEDIAERSSLIMQLFALACAVKGPNVVYQAYFKGTNRPEIVTNISIVVAAILLIVNYLAWLAIVLVILATIVSLFYYTSSSASIVVLLKAALQVLGIVILRLLSQVLIDIPDIALFRALRTTKSK